MTERSRGAARGERGPGRHHVSSSGDDPVRPSPGVAALGGIPFASIMSMFRVLPGLPAYGPLAQPFPASWGRVGREGVVVEFTDATGAVWVGNFSPGLGRVSAVFAHPDGRRVL